MLCGYWHGSLSKINDLIVYLTTELTSFVLETKGSNYTVINLRSSHTERYQQLKHQESHL
jgi:hypothetical protein